MGLLLAAVPVSAGDRPASQPNDAKEIFSMDFEPTREGMTADEAWQEWQSVVHDSITNVQFYHIRKIGTGDGNGAYSDFSDTIFYIEADKDTLIYMKNGVVPTDGDPRAYAADTYKVEQESSPERAAIFDQYAEEGGDYIFRYTSGKVVEKDDAHPWGAESANSWNEYYQGVAANYRRNLFIRGIDVEDNTSYRVTVFVKAKNFGQTKPKFHLDMMRGYFNSEKPFSMGYVGNDKDKHPYEYNNAFEKIMQSNDITGDWQKVTFMTHYLNDSIADRYMYSAGYYWNQRWTLHTADRDFDYIKQPDNFFVRLAFVSDSTNFYVDNLTITKSSIAGVEHYDNMIRVDFGFDTNLKQLAEAAYAKTGINAIELPGAYFSVYGYYKRNNGWYPIDIASAEYHHDGYMYMWSKDINGRHNPFNTYDSVLVSFNNPVDKDELCLKYTGTLFPNAIDSMWIKDGKKLTGFSNELSKLNPNIVRNQYGEVVYSMKNLPPVMTQPEYERGSFQLDGSIKSMSFKFSRGDIDTDDQGETSVLALLKVEKSGVTEFWLPTANADSVVTFTRQNKYNTPLTGDYTFTLCGIKGVATDYAPNDVINYSFGEVSVPAGVLDMVTFAGREATKFTTESNVTAGFTSEYCTSKIADFKGLYSKGLMWGLYGVNNGAENNETKCAKLFYDFIVPEAADYVITYGMTGCQKGSYNDDCREVTYLINPDGSKTTLRDRGSSGFKPEEGGEITEVSNDTLNATLIAGSYRLVFSLPNEGTYGGSHKGGKILWYLNIAKKGVELPASVSIGYPYLSSLQKSLGALTSLLEKCEDNADDYTGSVYEATKVKYNQYKDFTDTKPSSYNAVIAELNTAIKAQNDRNALVEQMRKDNDAAIDTIALYDDDDLIEFQDLAAYIALVDLSAEVETLVAKNMTDDSIKGVSKQIKDAIATLDARRKLINDFAAQLAKTKALIDGQKFDSEQVYADMVAAYEEYVDFDVVGTSDADLTAAKKAVADAILAYDSYVSGVESSTVRVKALVALAEEQEVVFPDANKADIEERIANLVSDDVEIAEIYKSAIKIAILNALAEGDITEGTSIDMTSFIRNFNMYTAATVKSDENPAGELEYYKYNYGSPSDRWHLRVTNNTTVFPGWKLTANGGNAHVGSEATDWREAKAPVFDAYLGLDWNSGITIAQEVTNLPAGLYELGVAYTYNEDAGAKQVTIASTADSTYSVTPASKSNDVAKEANTFADSIAVTDGKLTINLATPNVNSWVRVDNWSLKLKAKIDGVDYAAAAAEEQTNLNALLTFVDAEAEAVAVSYYSIDGIQIDAPKAGAIVIKVTEFANGDRLVEKILVK